MNQFKSHVKIKSTQLHFYKNLTKKTQNIDSPVETLIHPNYKMTTFGTERLIYLTENGKVIV